MISLKGNTKLIKGIFFVLILIIIGCELVMPIGHNHLYRRIEIGDDNTTYIDGDPLFPIGIFSFGSLSKLNFEYDTLDELFSDIGEGGFNTLHTYYKHEYWNDYPFKEFLLKAEEYGFQLVMPSNTHSDNLDALTTYVSNYMDTNALLSWYLFDEPEQNNISSEKVKLYHDIIKNVDSHHLTSIVVGLYEHYSEYIDQADIFMVDIYPMREENGYQVTQVSNQIDLAYKAMEDKGIMKPIWVVLQAFGYQDDDNRAWGWDREPTYEEERCMTYLSIVHGAKGIFYYCYGESGLPGSGSDLYFIPNSPDHWQGIKNITKELKELNPVLVLPNDFVDSLEIDSPQIHFSIKNYENKRYLFAVNTANQDVIGNFTGLESNFNYQEIDTLSILFEQRELVTINGTFSDHFKPFEVHIYIKNN